MLFSLLPTTALAAGNYPDHVRVFNASGDTTSLGDKQYLAANDATNASDSYDGSQTYVARYDKSSGTLYLNDYHGVTTADSIFAGGDLNIVVESNSSFNTSTTATGNLYGIRADRGKLNISGTGKLTVTAKGSGNVYGISAKEGVTIAAPLAVTVGKNSTTENGQVYGIHAQSGTISLPGNDMTVTATGGAENAYGVYNEAQTSSSAAGNGNIDISGKLTVDLRNGSNNRGISSQGSVITLDGATVKILGSYCYGIFNLNGNVVIKNSPDVELTSTTPSGEGICTYDGGDLTIENSTVKVSANTLAANLKGNVSIKDSKVELTSTYNHYEVIRTGNSSLENTIDLSGSGTVTLTASGEQTFAMITGKVKLGTNTKCEKGNPDGNGYDGEYDTASNTTVLKFVHESTAPTANISLDKTGTVDFGSKEAGYSTAPAAQSVTITNSGTAATGPLTIALDGDNMTDFTLNKTNITNIAASDTETFTVQPNTGLSAGTYTATVKVSGTGTGVTEQRFDVQFTVTAPVPSATVDDVTISGTVGQSFTDQDVVITLVNDKFKSLPTVGGSVSDLFPDLNDTALIAKLKSVNKDANRTVLTATISGVADKEINKVMDIVIPPDRLESGKALTVTQNLNAKFAIKKVSLPTSLKICKEDGTVVTTDTLTTGSTAQNVKYTAKVYDQYDEMLSGSHTINWDLTPSGALSTTASNPTPQMNLQLAANANAGTYTLTATLGGTEIKSSITIEVIQPKAGLLTAPTGKTDLKYNGTDQELLATPGVAENGTLRYRVEPSSTGSYSEEMPKAKDTNTYKVWYYVKGNAGYADTAYESIDVKIEKGDVEVSNIKVTSPAEITTDTNINDIKFSCDAVIAGTPRKAGGELSLSGGQSLSVGTKEYNLTFLPTLTSNLNVKRFIKYSLTVKAPEHNITVRSDGNGAATASLAKAPAGTAITLTATPNAGYHFKAWKVVSGGVTIANESSATTTFTMLAKDVTIEASFEKNASSGGGGSGGGSYVPKTQKPEIKAAAGGKTVLSKDGTTLTITADAGKVIDKVLLNGKDMGAVSELKGLKTGDKVEVIFKDQVTEPTKEELDKAAKEAAGDLVLTARSAKLKNGSVKVMLKGDLKAITDAGYTVKYKFYRSTKKSAGYKAVLTKKAPSYVNTYGKKGTMYYYKAKVMIYDKEGNFVAQTALKQCKYASRLWTK